MGRPAPARARWLEPWLSAFTFHTSTRVSCIGRWPPVPYRRGSGWETGPGWRGGAPPLSSPPPPPPPPGGGGTAGKSPGGGPAPPRGGGGGPRPPPPPPPPA